MSQSNVGDLLLAYNVDFVGFNDVRELEPAKDAIQLDELLSTAPEITGGATDDPDGYYDDFASSSDFTAQLQAYMRDYPISGGGLQPGLLGMVVPINLGGDSDSESDSDDSLPDVRWLAGDPPAASSPAHVGGGPPTDGELLRALNVALSEPPAPTLNDYVTTYATDTYATTLGDFVVH